ncbi:hypothetical protein [Komagataeibacter oboediens]|uniref:hypothetical protein n=1 Tax=Komagataeibacter oboediens TaxID=65958 RepID=UPI001C2CCE3B|nr:hypothetical protein [Komagataeibacter oboediens]MBV1823582.1 hypothetical protein [Komagataeibacter oboediens]
MMVTGRQDNPIKATVTGIPTVGWQTSEKASGTQAVHAGCSCLAEGIGSPAIMRWGEGWAAAFDGVG